MISKPTSILPCSVRIETNCQGDICPYSCLLLESLPLAFAETAFGRSVSVQWLQEVKRPLPVFREDDHPKGTKQINHDCLFEVIG
jgi:hypothetical protein